MDSDPARSTTALNVLGRRLGPCSTNPLTGYFRDGCCHTDPGDRGLHVICAEMTVDFLEFSASRGNDLRTAQPRFSFPGLQPGDRWCLCAARWLEAKTAGLAPPVVLESTHLNALGVVTLQQLMEHALDRPNTT